MAHRPDHRRWPGKGDQGMPKQFIRQFEASTYKHGARGIHSMAIRTRGDFVFLRGQTGFDLDGHFVGKGDPGAQAEQACKNVKQLMEEAGGRITDVCKLTVYVTDVSYRPAVYGMIATYFEGAHHCSTGVVVQGLALPELLVEIDAFAVIDR
jgi:enamine deaminase RidA (YjgF/YER057c/UK114 family)